MIDKYFSKYPNNLIAFRLLDSPSEENGHIITYKIIDFWFKSNWTMFEPEGDKVFTVMEKDSTKKLENDEYKYFIMYSDSMSFEEMFDFLSKKIDKNMDIERKMVLFHNVKDKLKQFFFENQYEDLKNIDFVINKVKSLPDDYAYKSITQDFESNKNDDE